ncbi:hypothetical protein QAD02_004255 [Eretmocerus hayati]|uniref:Uncharacterized protein n=1 Tax=Eretmocerus hayati TaxID=131215 RepID=A0ACC2NRQ8_9HYME|nr:hypothetical protein QAD02_004255 [Eretmocerus hayati]
MKWPTWPTATELLSKKAFLSNREDLKVIKEEGRIDQESPTTTTTAVLAGDPSAGEPGTWPLSKMRKRRPREDEHESSNSQISVAGGGTSSEDMTEDDGCRPATASLEAPLVLDPRLVDKLDMSLLSKEKLTASLAHICLGLDKVAPLVKSPTPRKAEVVASNNNYQPSTTATAINKRLKPRGPEACTSCGRSSQPERLHSHPRSPVQSPQSPHHILSIAPTSLSLTQQTQQEQVTNPVVNQPSKSTPSVIPVRSSRNLHHQPISARPAVTVAVAPAPSNHQLQLEAQALMDDKIVSGEATKKRRPRSVTCYVCGRDFGSASFPIHEPKCLERFHRENKELPTTQRRNVPERPNLPIDHEDWNAAAWSQSQALLIPCSNCKRTFLPDRLAVHEKTCRAQPKSNRSSKQSCPSVSIKTPANHQHQQQGQHQLVTQLQRSARSVQELMMAHKDRPASPRGCCIPTLVRSRPPSPARQTPPTVSATVDDKSPNVPDLAKRNPGTSTALQVKKSSSRIAVRQKSSHEQKRVV